MNNNSQVNPTASTDNADFYSFNSLISKDFMNEIKQIGIKGMESSINQIPTAANDHTAVVTSHVTTAQGGFSGIGAATPEMVNGSTSPQVLIDHAMGNSIMRSLQIATAVPAITTKTIDVSSPAQDRQQKTTTQKKYIHSPSKPITPAQRNSLEGIARQHGTTLEVMAQEQFGKSIDQLSSKDANALFQGFNNRSIFG